MAEPRPARARAPRAGLPRRCCRVLVRGLSWTLLAWGLAALGGMNLTTPVDYALNLGSLPHDATLEAEADGCRHLVVLEHGLFRSAGAMWKLERALRDHGYEVLNVSYASTAATIEEHAEALGNALEKRLAGHDARPLELAFVGHSMGGLVVRSYLQRPGARQASRVVFLATPQRGARLCDLRKGSWLFQLMLGDRAALELSPSHAFFSGLVPLSCPCGTIIGGKGDALGWHRQIPGDDDGTVAVAEAELPGAADSIVLPYGHTRISYADGAIEQVLAFLAHARFRHPAEHASVR